MTWQHSSFSISIHYHHNSMLSLNACDIMQHNAGCVANAEDVYRSIRSSTKAWTKITRNVPPVSLRKNIQD